MKGFKEAKESLQRARRGSAGGGTLGNQIEADAALADGLGESLGRIEELLLRIVVALEDRRGAQVELAEPAKPGFFQKWLS